jgi:putative toxin-antitoxin system antitoxin component (TIGR02293 family)
MSQPLIEKTTRTGRHMRVVRQVRHRLHLSQEGLSRRLNATKGAVQHWERGRKQPDLFHLRALRDICPPGAERVELDRLIRMIRRQSLLHGTGGRTRGATLGLTATTTAALIHQVEQGLPFEALESLGAASGLSVPVIATVIGVPERTLARRKKAGRLSMGESERLLRVSTVFEKAVELFEGDVKPAVTWLTSPKKALGDRLPLEYSRTELGAREVEDLMGRLEDGVFS